MNAGCAEIHPESALKSAHQQYKESTRRADPVAIAQMFPGSEIHDSGKPNRNEERPRTNSDTQLMERFHLPRPKMQERPGLRHQLSYIFFAKKKISSATSLVLVSNQI